MELIDFLVKHWDSILLLAAIAAALLVPFIKSKKKVIYKMLYALVTEAEKTFGSGTGALKSSYVLERLYASLPTLLKLILPYATLQKWIEEALQSAKEEWAKEAGVELYIEEGAANAEGMWRELTDGKGEEV